MSTVSGAPWNTQDAVAERTEAVSIGQAINSQAKPLKYLVFRGHLYAQQGRWWPAADDLSRVARLDPLWALHLGPLLVETGNSNSSSSRRALASVTFSSTKDPETAAEAAMEMCLRPSNGGWSVPAQLAETAITRGTNHLRLPYFQLVKGLVEYRQGRFETAVEWSQKSLAGSGTNYTTVAAAGAVMAMAKQQLKQTEEARKSLARATQVFETKLSKLESGDLGENWPEWLIARILLREATELVGKK